MTQDINPVKAGGPVQVGDSEQRLSGNLGTLSVFFAVLAYNAPLAVFVGLMPIVIGLGNGLGAPLAIALAGAILIFFSVGFVAMGKDMPNPGAFYSYVTAGLGKAVGLGTSFLALAAYSFTMWGSYAYFGIAAKALIHDTFGGPDLPWWLLAIAIVLVVAVLGYLNIELSAKVLGVFLLAEIVLVAIWDFVVVGKVGVINMEFASSFAPSAFNQGNIGLALMFSFLCFGGFEATAVFREEVRNPNKTIPRATYLTVGFITVFYTVGSWLLIQAIGPSTVVEATAADPIGSVLETFDQYLGGFTADVLTVLLVTSIIAALIATHNVTSRYLFNLGVDRVMPVALGAAHPKFGSPHRSSIIMTVASLVVVGVMVVSGQSPTVLYAAVTGLGGFAILCLMFLASVAVLAYYRRNKSSSASFFARVLSPAIAAIGLGVAAILGVKNFALLIGGDQNVADVLLGLVAFFFLAGIVVAVILRRVRPDSYRRIGRQHL